MGSDNNDVTHEAYAHALKLLNRKNYFIAELESKIVETFPDADTNKVIEQLKQDRYLNDDRFLEDFIRWRVESGYGQYYIREKLRQKGVNRSIQDITYIIEDLGIDMSAVITDAVRKYKRTRNKKPEQFMKACLTWLSGRGFISGDCIKILKQEVDVYESDFFEGC